MEVIPANTEHINDIYDLMCELADEQLIKDDFIQIYNDNMSNSDIYYFLEVSESTVIGFASLHIQKLLHHCAKIGEIQEIIVSKKYQGLGAGSALFNKVRAVAILNNCLQLEVCCNQTRERSHKFYLKQGMKKSHYKFTFTLKINIKDDDKE